MSRRCGAELPILLHAPYLEGTPQSAGFSARLSLEFGERQLSAFLR